MEVSLGCKGLAGPRERRRALGFAEESNVANEDLIVSGMAGCYAAALFELALEENSVDAVKAHLRALFDRFGLGDLPQNEKRSRLAARVLADGILTPRDF